MIVDTDALADQAAEALVRGDNGDATARGRHPQCDGGDDIVGLETFLADGAHAAFAESVLQTRQDDRELFRHRIAVGLVVGKLAVTPRRRR